MTEENKKKKLWDYETGVGIVMNLLEEKEFTYNYYDPKDRIDLVKAVADVTDVSWVEDILRTQEIEKRRQAARFVEFFSGDDE